MLAAGLVWKDGGSEVSLEVRCPVSERIRKQAVMKFEATKIITAQRVGWIPWGMPAFK